MGVIGLVVAFLIGTLRPISLGALSLVMTFLIGSLFRGETPREMFSGFPVDLFVLLAGVTYLFGIAASNGTVERIVEWAVRLVKHRRALLPWIVFVVAAMPAMAGAIGSAGVAMLTPLSLRIAERCGIDRRMMGLMVIHGAACGNFSPLNVLGLIVSQTVERAGLHLSFATLFWGNLAYNVLLGVVIFLIFGGSRLTPGESVTPWSENSASPRLRVDQILTLVALLVVATAAFAFGLNIGFLAFTAGVALQLIFPKTSAGADKKIAWDVVLLVCGVVTYIAALQRYGTVQAVGGGLATISAPLITALLICAVGAITSAFASSAGILGALIPLAVPFMARGEIDTTGMVVALAISATAVDATPFSTVGALVVANANDKERTVVYRGLLLWGAAMVATAPLLTWLIFILPS